MAELLAPAGGFEQLRVALNAGADAVYLGYTRFSARASAQNFDEEQLRKALSLAGEYGAKCYLALNTLYTDLEREEILSLICTVAELGIDGVILQDLGLCRLLKQTVPDLKLHASTQLSVQSREGARQLKELGFSRVVLARELSISEIAEITSLGIETEVFVHGALCFSLSGQCYLSGFLGGRSANRGRCAQPCRLPFSATGTDSADLSLKDLCAVNSIPQLCSIGVTSLKIEGRMKRPEYVAAATAAYRAVLDGKTPDILSLQKVFSRGGFTNGYLEDDRDSGMFGVRGKEDIAEPSLLKEISNRYRKPTRKVSLVGRCVIRVGQPAKLELTDGTNRVEVVGDVVEQAERKTLTEEQLKGYLSKLEDTPYEWKELNLFLGEGCYLPASAANRLRREAVQELACRRGNRKPLDVFCRVPRCGGATLERCSPALRARFRHITQIDDPSNYRWIELPIDEILNHPDKVEAYREKLIATASAARFGSESVRLKKRKKLKEIGINHLLVSNIEDFRLKSEFTLHGDYTLHVTNSDSLEFLKEMGLVDTLLSVELRSQAIQKLNSDLPYGIIVYGRLPLMTSRNCPIKAKIGCKQCGGKGSLTDRLGKRFPVRCREEYCEIFNSVPISLSDLPWRESVSFGSLYFTEETSQEVAKITQNVKQSVKLDGEYTRGFYNKNSF